jgi:hypothetical protein
MGRQDSVVQLTGGVGNLSFYKTQDGYLARKKTGVSAKRIKSDPAFARTRENIAEFTRSGRAAKLLRTAFSSLLHTAADNRVTSRLNGVMMRVIKADAVNPRGQRNVIDGEAVILEGFEFNQKGVLTNTFKAQFTPSIDRATGNMRVDIPAFRPAHEIVVPEGATHFRMKSGGAAIDFERNTYSVVSTEGPELPITDQVQGPLELLQAVPAGSTFPLFLVFGIEFLQLVNGTHSPLNNGAFNAVAIVKVDGGVE